MKTGTRIRTIAAIVAAGVAGAVGLAAARDSSPAPSLPGEVMAAASGFAAYTQRAAQVSGRFSSGDGVVQSLRASAAYEPGQFQEGMIGYGALAALRDARFVAAVRGLGKRDRDRQAWAQALAANTGAVVGIDGADEAAAKIEAALRGRAEAISGAGQGVKVGAYQVQHQAWSKVTVSDPHGRLAEVKSLSSAPFTASPDDEASLFKAIDEASAGPGQGGDGFPPLVVQSLALAAEAILGAARDQDLPRLRPLLSDFESVECLRRSKLNLYQCMAVAGPQYEDVFCLGQHALIETGECMAKAATPPPDAIDRLLAAQSAPPLASPAPHARRYAANTRRAPKANAN